MSLSAAGRGLTNITEVDQGCGRKILPGFQPYIQLVDVAVAFLDHVLADVGGLAGCHDKGAYVYDSDASVRRVLILWPEQDTAADVDVRSNQRLLEYIVPYVFVTGWKKV